MRIKTPYKSIGIPLTIILALVASVLIYSIYEVRKSRLSKRSADMVARLTRDRSVALFQRYLILKKSMKNEDTESLLEESRLLVADENKWRAEASKATQRIGEWLLSLFGSTESESMEGNMRAFSRDLELAYFKERLRIYDEAISLYSAISERRPPLNILGYAYLHRGFCYTMLGKRKKAIEDFRRLQKLRVPKEMKAAASFFLRELRKNESKRERLAKMDLSLKKAVGYLKILDYDTAVSVFSKLLKQKKESKVYYYRGRAYEESGRTEKAILDYRTALKIDPKSEAAKAANRRLYMLGAIYGSNQEIKKEAQANSKKIGDKKFFKTVAKVVTSANYEVNSPIEKTSSVENMPSKKPVETQKQEMEAKEEEPEEKFIKPRKSAKKKVTKPKKEKSKKKKVVSMKKALAKSTSKEERKEFLKTKYKKLDKIFTEDGNIFIGAVIGSDDKTLKMITVFGVVKIPKEKITMRLKVQSKVAIK